MVGPIGLDSGLLTLSIFALNASTALHSTVSSIQSHPKSARNLLDELRALTEDLGLLSDTISGATDIDLSVLDIPLLRCGTACEEFEQEIRKCLSQSDDGSVSPRGWARLRYMGGDINNFRDLLSVYKLTIRITLTDAHLCRQSSVTVESLKAHEGLIETAKTDLGVHLESLDERMELIPDLEASERQQLKEERESIEKCLQICTELSDRIDEIEAKQKEDDRTARSHGPPTYPDEHRKANISTISNYSTGDAVQFMISTDGSIINGTNQGLGWRSRQLGGHLSDTSAQQILKDFASINIRYTGKETSHTRSDASSTADNENSNQSVFDKRYGRGSVLSPKPTQVASTTPLA